MNKVFCTGYVAFPIEKKEKGETVYIRNTINVSRGAKNTEGKTIFDSFTFVAFGYNAEYLSNYAKKGDKILIEGRLQKHTKERLMAVKDENGDYRTKSEAIAYHEIIVNSVEILSVNKKSTKTNNEEGVSIKFSEEDTPIKEENSTQNIESGNECETSNETKETNEYTGFYHQFTDADDEMEMNENLLADPDLVV